MPYKSNRQLSEERKYLIRFRGSAIIPRLNQMAPCRLELTIDTIGSILESLYRRPLRMEVMYVDKSGKEWELKYSNYRKILPTEEEKVVVKAIETPKPVDIIEEEIPFPDRTLECSAPVILPDYTESKEEKTEELSSIEDAEVSEDDPTLDEIETEVSVEEDNGAKESPMAAVSLPQQQQYHSKNYKKHHKK